MVWDSTHNALFASTECNYFDSFGRNHGYRRAKIPAVSRKGSGRLADSETVVSDDRGVARASGSQDSDDEDGSDDPSDDDDDHDDYEDRCWPIEAFFAEDYFGYVYDAGRHKICELQMAHQ